MGVPTAHCFRGRYRAYNQFGHGTVATYVGQGLIDARSFGQGLVDALAAILNPPKLTLKVKLKCPWQDAGAQW